MAGDTLGDPADAVPHDREQIAKGANATVIPPAGALGAYTAVDNDVARTAVLGPHRRGAAA